MADAKKIIKGTDLMLFDEAGKSIGYASSHVLTLNGETTEVSTKDNGIYGAVEVQKITWEATSENLYTTEEYGKLFLKMIAREKVKIFFGLKAENDPTKTVADGDYPNWTKTTGCLTGDAYITSLVCNANSGENATFSVTFSGAGAITQAEV